MSIDLSKLIFTASSEQSYNDGIRQGVQYNRVYPLTPDEFASVMATDMPLGTALPELWGGPATASVTVLSPTLQDYAEFKQKGGGNLQTTLIFRSIEQAPSAVILTPATNKTYVELWRKPKPMPLGTTETTVYGVATTAADTTIPTLGKSPANATITNLYDALCVDVQPPDDLSHAGRVFVTSTFRTYPAGTVAGTSPNRFMPLTTMQVKTDNVNEIVVEVTGIADSLTASSIPATGTTVDLSTATAISPTRQGDVKDPRQEVNRCLLTLRYIGYVSATVKSVTDGDRYKTWTEITTAYLPTDTITDNGMGVPIDKTSHVGRWFATARAYTMRSA